MSDLTPSSEDAAEFVSVGRFLTRETAEIARAALAEAGIEATVSADDVGGMVPSMPNGVDLMVLSTHAEAARELIDSEDQTDSPSE